MLTWSFKENNAIPQGMHHYYTASQIFFKGISRNKQTVMIKEFEDYFYTFEESYFKSVGEHVETTTNIIMPQSTRMIYILSLYTQ